MDQHQGDELPQSQAPQDRDEEKPFKAGTLRSIKLTNFMCHDSFEIQFGSRVNFVMGPNGSGKSAILTAIVFALGASANSTARGKSAKEFLKYGKPFAKVTLTLHNYNKVMDKERGYKPDDYGKTITIEKTIHQNDSAFRLVLKNDKGKKVSESRAELLEMLEHFSILLNNPICILNQEVSKTFLHSQRAQDKFDLFMKATNLEEIEQNLKDAKQSQKSWKGSNERSEIQFRLLDNEFNSCKEKLSMIENITKLDDIKQSLHAEMLYSCLATEEKEVSKYESAISVLQQKIEKSNEEIDKKNCKIKQYEDDISGHHIQEQSFAQDIDQARTRKEETRMKENDLRNKKVHIESEITSTKRRIAHARNDVQDLEKSIENHKRRLEEANILDRDSERRKMDIERIERELPADKASEKSIRHHSNQLSSSMTQTRGELHSANTRVSDTKNKLSHTNAILRRLKNGQDNELRKYGDFVIKIRDEIERAFAAGRFKEKPIGPLGYYLKLESQDIAGPLELCLGRNAHAFLCDNTSDMQALTLIFRKIAQTQRDFRQPMIITRAFKSRHDISRTTARHPIHKTLLDYLDVQNDPIYNVLLDRTSLECKLFIPDYHEAQNLLLDASAIPKNTICAYTKDCSLMHPITSQGGYRSYANNPSKYVLFSKGNTAQIKHHEKEIELLQADLRDAENIAKTIEDNLKTQRREYDQNQAEVLRLVGEIRKKEETLLNMKTTVAVQPEELQALERDRDHKVSIQANERLKLSQLNEELSDLEKDLAEIRLRKSERDEAVRNLEGERYKVLKVIQDTKQNLSVAQSEVRKHKTFIASWKTELVSLSAKKQEAVEKAQRSKQEIPHDTEKPATIRSVEVIHEEIKKVDAQIRIEREENRDPVEVKRLLEERMRSIENQTFVKDQNMENFKLATKSLGDRRVGFTNLRHITVGTVSTTFSRMMRSMKMNGELEVQIEDEIDSAGNLVKKGRTLDMKIDTHYAPSASQRVMSENSINHGRPGAKGSRNSSTQPADNMNGPRPKRARMEHGAYANNGSRIDESGDNLQEKENGLKMTDSRSLSGGERSFSTIAFVLALWQHSSSPFKLMDEIDVFMDMVTRRVSYNALIRFAQGSGNPGQVIFFTPLELPTFEDDNNYVRIFEMPQIIRKAPQSQQEATA